MYKTTLLFSLLLGLFLYPSFSSAQMVWPGDVNNNGTVNGIDYLYWGVASPSTGPNRPNSTTEWIEQPMGTAWLSSFPQSTNYAYADANGDGQINANDSEVISDHFNRNHGVYVPDDYQESYADNAPPIGFDINDAAVQPRESKRVGFLLGDQARSLSDFYGLSFALTYPAMALNLEDGLGFGLFPEAFLNSNDNNVAVFIHNDPVNGRAEITMVRTDGEPLNGFGKVGQFLFRFSDLSTQGLSGDLLFEVVDIMAIDFEMNPIEMASASFSFSNAGGISGNCPSDANPVCGSNGVTYLNPCYAEAAGIYNYTNGTCFDNSCIDPLQINPATICTTVYEPVCGCNGVTYSNQCVADAAGVLSTTTGPCPTNNNDCYDPQYVVTNNATTVDPYTGAITVYCAAQYDPVCGCNGVTYANVCLAEASGITIYTQGSCESACVDPYLMDWDANCTTEYNPVCGCNDVTYTNPCVADAAGVTSYTSGPCGGNSAWCQEAIPVQCGDFLSYQSTTEATNNIQQYPGCGGSSSFLAPDRIYVIQKETAGDLQIGLEILTAGLDLDLFLLSNNCNQITCIASSTTNNSATNNEGIILEDAPIGTYYIVVDGQYASSKGDFHLEVSCGYLYCGDAVTLWCGEQYSGSNYSGHDDVSLYQCEGNVLNVENNGPEIVHTFTQTQAGPVTISLSGLSANLELFLLRSCDSGECIEYSQNSGNSSEFISAYLPAGTYYVIVDGYNGSVSSYNLLVNCGSGCGLEFTELYATSSDCGQASGVIHIRSSGGLPYYLISYTGPLSGSFTTSSDYCTISNLPPGTYTVTKSDSQGCSITETVTILGGGNLSANLTPHDAVCSSQGSIGVYMSNGQAPYSIYLTGPSGGVNSNINSNNFTINDLDPGDYTVHITDYNGCSVSQQITINQSNGNFIWNYTVTAASCGGYGAIHVDTYNGDAPYTIQLSGPVSGGSSTYYSSFNIINLPGGVYELTIEDNNWCRNTQTIVIPDGNLDVNLTATAGICGQYGSITVDISNGWPIYTIGWSGPVSGTVQTNNSQYVLSNLPAGSYTVSVEDDAGCTDYQTITISNGEGGLDFDVIPLPGTCDQNGALWIDIYNGSPLYTISWTGTASGILTTSDDGLDIPNLPCGWYHIIVTDINGCSASTDVELGGCSDLDIDLTPTNGLCGQYGSILVSMYGGSPIYNVTWSGPVSGQAYTNTNITNISNLPAGSYTVNVTDANGCTDYAVTQISTAESNLVLTTLITEATCGTSGSITAYLSGGVGPYQISWTGPESGSISSPTATATIPNLISGTYQIYVTDANGCSDSKTVYITNQTNNLTISLVGNDGICSQYGNIGVYVVTGNGPFTVSWTGPASGSASFSGTVYQIANTPAGLYNVIVTDADGCSTSDAVQINIQNALNAYLTPYNGQCGTNGSIQVNISQGSPNYTITWSGPSAGSTVTSNQQYTIANLVAGDYTVVVVDQNGCSRTMNTTILHSNDGLEIITSLIYNICGQYNTIWTDIIGGTPPYTVTWTGTETGTGTTSSNGFEIMDLPPGTYKVTVVDANGCMDMQPGIIIYPAPVNLFTAIPNNGICGENGSIQININNIGTAPFTLTWNGPVSGTQNYASSGIHILNNLPSGTYNFTLNDANGCTETETVVLNNGGSPVEIITALIYNDCGQYNTIWTDIIGGTPPYTVTWTGTETGTGTTSSNGFEIMDLPPGTYKVTVVDVYGCMDMEQDIIVYPAPVDIFTAVPTNGLCSGPGSILVNVLAGTPAYNLTWTGPANGSVSFSTSAFNITNLPAGTYTLTLIDANGCAENETVTISTGEGDIYLSATPSSQTCISSASITVQASGGNGSYVLSWTGPESGSANIGTSAYLIDNLTPGSYSLSIGDGSGCDDTESVYLSIQEDDLYINLTPYNGICGSYGSIGVSISGSQAPYSVSWTGPSTGSTTINGQFVNIPNLASGYYTVFVTGYDGCFDNESITISSSESDLYLATTPNHQTCNSAASISVQASGGNGSYTLNWSGPESGSANIGAAPYLINNLTPGTYTLTIVDGSGCSDTATVYVTSQEDDLNINLTPHNGVCGSYGNIDVYISGSQSPYTVSWTGSNNGSTTVNGQFVNIPNLTTGSYTIQVTGYDGCSDIAYTQINNQSGNIYITATPYSGGCGSTGSINVALNGASSYTLQWTGPSNGSTTVNGSSYIINNLQTGVYTITASSGGCTTSTTATVYTNSNNVTISATPHNGSCVLASSIDVLLGGGVAPYQLSWQGPQDGLAVVNGNSYTINNISEGLYTLTAIDANGCSRSTNVSVSQNNLDINVTPYNGTCGDNASISLAINYGTAPYTINWAGNVDGFAVSQSNNYTIQYLPAGSYQITVQDANGCSEVIVSTVTSVPGDVDLSITSGSGNCGAFGNIWMDFSYGTPPYTIQWFGPASGSETTYNDWYDLQDTPSGSYTIVLSDANGCVDVGYAEVSNIINNLDVNVTPTPGSCGGLGSIGVSVQGGQPSYTIAWYLDNVAIGEVDINGNYYSIPNLADGEYFIRITDQNECLQSVFVGLISSDNNLYVSPTVTAPSCIGAGTIGLIMDGGEAPYQINWTGPMSSSATVYTSYHIISGLTGGNYQVTVTDVNGCGTILNLIMPGTTQGEVVSDFSYIASGLTVNFESLASNDYHIWDMGDGSLSYDTHPEHTFPGPGTYHVCLGVSGSCGFDNYCQDIVLTTGGSNIAVLDIGESVGSTGSIVSVPVILYNAGDFVSIAGSINVVNESVATIVSVTPGVIAPQYNTANNTFSYFTNVGSIDIGDGEATLFYLNVLLSGTAGQSSVIEFSNVPLPVEVGAYIGSSPVAIPVTTTAGSATATNMVELNGQLVTYWGDGIMDAEVTISGTEYNGTQMTNEDGSYFMPELLPNASYTVSASKSTAYENGLSTYALFIGQRFLLGMNPIQITSPYQVIAGDANCNDAFTTLDLFLIQRLIIGAADEFNSCPSWVFVSDENDMPAAFDAYNVFPYSSSATMLLTENETTNFVGVKVGDILGQANPEEFGGGNDDDSRTNGNLSFRANNTSIAAGEEITLYFNSNDFEDIVSYQFGLQFPADQLQFLTFEAGELSPFETVVVGDAQAAEGKLRLSWFSLDGQGHSANEETSLFALRFRALEDITDWNGILRIDPVGMLPEAYNDTDIALEPLLSFRETITDIDDLLERGFELYQNKPNPFKDQTSIGFYLPRSENTIFSLRDALGRVVLETEKYYGAGEHQITIDRSSLAAGVYYYILEAGDKIATKAMVIE